MIAFFDLTGVSKSSLATGSRKARFRLYYWFGRDGRGTFFLEATKGIGIGKIYDNFNT